MFETEIEGKKYNSFQARGADQYKVMLFPEAITGDSGRDTVLRIFAGKILKVTNGNFRYYPNVQTGSVPAEVSLGKLNKIFGGQTRFFNKGEQVLDIGSGAGVAVAQLQREHPEVNFVGIDHGYIKRLSPAFPNSGFYVSGDWNHLPFADDSFTRLLSLESFPKHAEWIWDFESTFREVTRVSKLGALWRGTHIGLISDQKVDENEWVSEMYKQMNNNGWDVYVNNRIFVSELVRK